MKSPKISFVRAALLAGIAAPGLLVAAPVLAQNAADEAESGGDEIIVTARRREESLRMCRSPSAPFPVKPLKCVAHST